MVGQLQMRIIRKLRRAPADVNGRGGINGAMAAGGQREEGRAAAGGRASAGPGGLTTLAGGRI
jgi:hypothetical protein